MTVTHLHRGLPAADQRPAAGPAVPAGGRALPALLAGAVAVAAGVLALVLPDVTTDAGAGAMTHYMGLLAANQPWNLLLFMALPVVLAETLTITELWVLASGEAPPAVRALNRLSGVVAGPLFLVITIYLTVHAVLPLTTGAGWHGAGDVVAVLAYLSGVVPLVGVTLIEAGLLAADDAVARRRLHAGCVGVFLVVAHVAMIFGMLDPGLFGWVPEHAMPGM